MTQEQKNYLKEALQRARLIEMKCNSSLKTLYYQTDLYKLTAYKRTLAIECAEYIERTLNNGLTGHEKAIQQQQKLL